MISAMVLDWRPPKASSDKRWSANDNLNLFSYVSPDRGLAQEKLPSRVARFLTPRREGVFSRGAGGLNGS
jgi:hypothetical protein